MKKIRKTIKKAVAVVLILSMLITSSLSSFPFGIKTAHAAVQTIVLNYTQTILTEGTAWTVPADWTSGNNTIEVIGGGGAGFTDTTGIAGAAGGGGGAYSKSVNQTLTPGSTVTYAIGVGGKNNAANGGAPNGGDTYFCSSTTNCTTIAGTAVIAGAKGGVGATNQTGAAGGLATGGFAYGTGLIKNNGGTGGAGGNATSNTGGGGGGAGGPQAAGKTGGAGYTAATGGGGGGGGGNGGTSSAVGAVGTATGGAGGAGDLGTGGGTGGSAANGGNGTTSGAGGGGSDGGFNAGNGFGGANLGGGVGPGGGGGGSGDMTTAIGMGGNGGLYGAGGGGGRYGGRGAPGVIIITYNGNTPTRSTWNVPADWDNANNTIEVIGGGGSSYSIAQGSGTGGGGGGAYSKATNVTLTQGGTVTYAIGAGGRKTIVGVGAGVNGGDTYFCNATGANCTAITGSAVVAGAKGGLGATSLTGALGGAAASGIGDAGSKWSGGAGGSGHNTGDSGGGGGGAAGSSQNGLNGGIGYTSASGGGGGGGGAGDDSGTNSTVGGAGVAANGGAGGQGPLGTGSGGGGANTFGGDATAGLGGGGGGGDTPYAGGEGGSGSATTYGGGGGGGTGDSNSVATGALFGGDGGLFGAGGGGALMPGFGANGIIIITYTQLVSTTTLATGTNPGDSAIAPGGAITSVNGFTLTTNTGTDAITAITVNLSTNNGVGTLTITDGVDTVLGSIGGGIGTGIVTGSNSISITSTNATTGGTAFKVKVTPLSHANMPAPAGGEYAITGVVIDWTGTNTKAGQATDTSDTVTIDNASPNGATSVSGVAGNAAVTINWTASNSTDFNTTSGSVIYRWTGGTAGTEVPAEGSTATIGAANGTATTACVVSSAISATLSKIDGTGGSAECTTAALTNGQAYTYKAFQKDTNGNYDAGVSIGSFTPSAAAAYLTQNNFRFYLTANSVTLTDPWPSGTLDLGEKAALTQLPVQNLALVSGDKIRIKINFGVTVTNLAATTQAFQMEYSAAEDCTTASSWTAVGAKASASIWRLFDEAAIGDSTVEVNNLGDSTIGAQGYYSEINPSATNPNAVNTSQFSEWDWPLEDNGAAENTTYCFRMAKSGGAALDVYNADSYPKITTAPGVSILMRHGNFFQNQAEKGFFWTN